jgi:iron-sulfur cluster repair protein YtfE (RIC family)
MAVTHRDLQIFLLRYVDARFYFDSRIWLRNKELSILSRLDLKVASIHAARDKDETLELGQIYKRYRALDQDIRSLLNHADQILKSVSELISAETYTEAKSAVVRLKEQASSFENDIKELLKVVFMDDGQALRRFMELHTTFRL